MSNSDDDIQRLPEINKRLGSCPDCGAALFESNTVQKETEHLIAVYRCHVCKLLLRIENIVPF